MRIILLHCNSFSYECVKAMQIAEEIEEKEKAKDFHDVIVLLACVEKSDESRKENVKESFLQDVAGYSAQLGCRDFVLYPYAHLSKNLSSPQFAKDFLKELEEELRKSNYNVHRSPFGWEKAFRIDCKGHPLSESYREY
jgi:threonyl-tRNA synthetase